MKNSATNDVLLHLQKHGSITPADAYWSYSCYRLADAISRLRAHYIITTEMTEGKNKYGRKTGYATYYYWGKKEDAESTN